MRNYTPKNFFLLLFLFLLGLQACRKDTASSLALPALPDQSFVEEFDTVSSAYDRGWRYLNVSTPKGIGFWTQGLFNNPSVTGFTSVIPFPAYSSKGTYVGFIGADYSSTSAGLGIISNWVVSPVTKMRNGDRIVFYTRGVIIPLGGGDSTDFSNRLQVRVSANDASLNVGNGDDPGDFGDVLLDINPFYREQHTLAYDPEAYPIHWTRFEAKVGGLNGAVSGRFAFRYYLEGAGFAGIGTGVAIDSVAYIGQK